MKNLLIVFLSVFAVFTVCMAVNAQDVPVSVTVPKESYHISIPTNEIILREEPTNLTVSATNVRLFSGNRLSGSVWALAGLEWANTSGLLCGGTPAEETASLGGCASDVLRFYEIVLVNRIKIEVRTVG